ncbi:MAG TPA: hypothetical protein VHL53_11325 [Acidimicrobiia bacterium]|nr:hypothetical protein [Acidimicrobiia bacterium]
MNLGDRRRTAGTLCAAAGIVALVLGWGGLAGAPVLSAQLPYVVSGGLIGLALLGVGLMLVMESALGRERGRLDQVERVILQRGRGPADA